MDFTSAVVLTMSLLHVNMQPVTGIASKINRITSDSNSSSLPLKSEKDVTVQDNNFSHKTSLKSISDTDISATMNSNRIKKSALSKRQVSSQNVVVHTSPENRIVKKGSSFNFLCEAGRPLIYCRINTPTANRTLNLHKLVLGGENYRYFGKGLHSGQCGIEIYHIQENGNFSCIMGVMTEPEELVGSTFVTVASAPKKLEILFNPQPVSIQEGRSVYKENTTLVTRCRVNYSRPAANISWFINGKLVTEGVKEVARITLNSDLVKVEQTLTRVLTREDDGMELKCSASHLALAEPLTHKMSIGVYYSPQVKFAKIQDKKIITVEINANPKPQISWTVGDIKIGKEDPASGFEVSEVMNKGKNLWQSTLTIHSNSSKLEEGTKYTVFAANDVGTILYEIIGLQDSDEDIKLGVDLIAGIVMASLVVVFLIGTILYAFVTRRWCFEYDIRLGDRPCF